jgi:hypothetical protein
MWRRTKKLRVTKHAARHVERSDRRSSHDQRDRDLPKLVSLSHLRLLSPSRNNS